MTLERPLQFEYHLRDI